MKKVVLAAAISLAALTTTIPAQAQEGAVSGAIIGGTTGAIVGGPVGLVIGGVTGAFIGDNVEANSERCWIERGRQVCVYR